MSNSSPFENKVRAFFSRSFSSSFGDKKKNLILFYVIARIKMNENVDLFFYFNKMYKYSRKHLSIFQYSSYHVQRRSATASNFAWICQKTKFF